MNGGNFIKAYIFLSFFSINILYAQDGSLDQSFNPGDAGFGAGNGANGDIHTVSLQANGKIVFAGQFDEYNSYDRERAARAEENGMIDPSFAVGDGFNNVVRTSAVQSDGKILFGGDFGQFNNQVRNRVLRLNSNGTIDNTFNAGGGADASVFAFAIQSDGKILIGGAFSSYNTAFINCIVRVNADGSVDNSFSVGTGPNGLIRDILIQPDGKILIAGAFTSYNGNPSNRLARINSDGSFDNTFDVGTGANNLISSIAIQNDNKVIIAGNFTTYNGNTYNRIARINADGSFDNSFTNGTGANAFITKVLHQPDGKVLAFGDFATFNGYNRNSVVRLNSDGTIDETFLISTGANASVLAAVLQPDGKIILGGVFTDINGVLGNRIARLNSNGSVDTTFNTPSGSNNNVQEFAFQPDGKILVGGNFTNYNNTNVGYFVRLDQDGSLDEPFSAVAVVDNEVLGIAIQSDGKIIIGGGFSNVNGVSRGRIARLNLDGSLDETFNPGAGFDNLVYEVTLQPDGKILVGGEFTFYDGQINRRLIRLNPDGTKDESFDTGDGAFSLINNLIVRPDGKIIIAGDAGTYNNIFINGLAVLNQDGSVYNGFALPPEYSGGIEKVALQNDGKIVVTGSFFYFHGIPMNHIARVNADGTLDNTFLVGSGGTDNIMALAIQPNGKILIGGWFNSFNGFATGRIARLNPNGSLDNTFQVGSGANAGVFSMGIQNNGKIMIGGLFTDYNNIGRNRIARLQNCTGQSLSTLNINTCNAYIAPNGQVFTNSGNYSITIQNAAGCDSIIALNLNISQPTEVVVNEIACNSFVAPDGEILTNSGTYNYTFLNGNGCDSLVQLNLTISNSSQNSISANACNSYTAANGEVYTTSGIYTQNFTNASGCDSTLTLVLEINYSATNAINAIGCTNYIAPDGQTFTQDGTYTVTIPTFYGCDSTITISLTLGAIDTTVNILALGFQANESLAFYQWLDCDNNFAPISGEVNREFFPSSPGNYAVRITNNGCVDTSACYSFSTVDLNKLNYQSTIKVYPNPCAEELTVECHGREAHSYAIVDITGNVVSSGRLQLIGHRGVIHTGMLAAGMYMLQLNNGQAVRFVRR